MYIRPLLSSLKNLDSVDWKFLDKETYMEIEGILTDKVVLFEPFLVEDFYPEEDFKELVEICNSYDLAKIDYSNQMNKWEEGIQIPQKFIDYAIEKVKSLIGTDEVMHGYHMYAHHQITKDGRVPRLPVHIDHSPGPYMVDLHIGGNRDWSFVAGDKEFITKPNQAIICQPQIDYHYRPSWNNDDPHEYYQALFFHLINRNHWCVPSNFPQSDRPKHLEDKYEFGQNFRNTDQFQNFQKQRSYLFETDYYKTIMNMDISQPPISEKPTEDDAHIHERKGILPKA